MLDNIRVLQQISSKVNDFIQYQSDLDTAVQRVGKQILDLQDSSMMIQIHLRILGNPSQVKGSIIV